MPLPVIADTHRLTFNYIDTSNGHKAHNVFHLLDATDDIAGSVAAVIAHLSDTMWFACASELKVQSVSGISLSTALGASTEISLTGAPRLGGGGVDYSPADSAIVKLMTGLRGREHRGRLYLPWVAESQVTKGLLASLVADDVSAAWETFRSDMSGAGRPLVVASYKHLSVAEVSSVLCERATGTQRRRQAVNR